MKKTQTKIDEIVELVRTEFPTRKALCERAGIDPKTLKAWESDPAVQTQMEAARRDYLIANMAVPAVRSLLSRIEGRTVTEEKVTYVYDRKTRRERKVSRVVTVKQIPPDMQAVIYVLTNLLPEQFEK